MDLLTIANALATNAPLVVAFAAASYFIFPRAMRLSLMNGGGTLVRAIVAQENEKQTGAHNQSIQNILDASASMLRAETSGIAATLKAEMVERDDRIYERLADNLARAFEAHEAREDKNLDLALRRVRRRKA